MLTKVRHEFQTYIQQIWNWSQVLVRCDYSTITGEGKQFTCRTSSSLIPPFYWHWKAFFSSFFFLKRVFKKKDLGLFVYLFVYFFNQCSFPSRFFLRKKETDTKQSQVEKKTTGVAWLRSFWSCTRFSRDTASELPEIMPKKTQTKKTSRPSRDPWATAQDGPSWGLPSTSSMFFTEETLLWPVEPEVKRKQKDICEDFINHTSF